MNSIKLLLSFTLISSLVACSSAPPPPPPPVPEFTTSMAREHMKIEKQDASIYFGNQLEKINVEFSPNVQGNVSSLAPRGLSLKSINSYLHDTLLNAGIYSPKSATGLTLNVLITDARIRSDFTAKSLGGIGGSDYLEATVTVIDKNGNVLSKADMSTPHESECPVNPSKNNKPMCGYKARSLQVKGYLMNEITDLIQGAFKP